MLDLTNEQSKKGALDALTLILAARKRKIQVKAGDEENPIGTILKMPKNAEMEEIPDEDDEDQESEEERQSRIDKINDTTEILKDVQEIKTDIDMRIADAQRAKSAAEKTAATKGQLMDFKQFGLDLYRAVKSQIGLSKNPEDTYSKVNPTYAGSDLLMPGQARIDKKQVPTVEVYFDQSGSWDNADIQKGLDAIATLDQFKRKGKIKIKLYFFADHLHTTAEDAASEGGTGGFDEVLSNIQATKASNVIIMTDDDIERQTSWYKAPQVNIKGCVWWLWKNGSKSKTAPTYLVGQKGNYQYNLT